MSQRKEMMSREIKFRAWDKEDEKYLLPENQEFVILPTKPSFGVTIPFQSESYPNENLDIDCVDWADADLLMGRYELEQYTGLKDKSGDKEIYEGDIISFENEKALARVLWLDGKAMFGLKWLDCGVEDELDYWSVCKGPVEVIGNIHENPELLEKLDGSY